jgi:hypothetical protein
MKMKQKTLFISLLLIAITGFGQLRIDRQPRSFAEGQKVEALPIIHLQKPDMQKIEQEDIEAESQFKMRRFGVLLPVGQSLFDVAHTTTTKDGTIYLARFTAEDALALSLYSNNFYLPEGGELYLYTADKSQIIGAFTAQNNYELRTFATELLLDDNIVIEYFQPSWQSDKATIEITEICYAYRDVEDLNKAAGSCNVNVNCSEGDNWRKQQRSVCRIAVKFSSGTGWCSGTLINNTAQDKSPYIISAAHCIEGITSSTNLFSQFVFYFNYETSGCSGSSSSNNKTLTGATLKAWDNTFADTNPNNDTGSDFCLMLLNNAVPANFNAYWCGWSRSTTASPSGVSIHHPDGDVKKISTYTSALQSSSQYTGQQTHWKVQWVQTSNGFGITEPGSSGSAIFNNKQQLVGTLSGGTSSCNASISDKVDWYGKFSYHWESNGTTDNRKLKPWLDPINNGVTELNGRDFNTGLDDAVFQDDNSLTIYPNPAQNSVTINILNNNAGQAIINIINSQGKTLSAFALTPNQTHITITTDSFTSGLYLVQMISNNRISNKKLIIEK